MKKNDVYEKVTDKIIEALENGTVPWQIPWNNRKPQNFISKKPYRGFNSLLLSITEHSSPYWMTYKQAVSEGGQVRKGEKATMIIFWKFLETKEYRTDNPEKKVKIPMLKYYNVFNLEQIDGIEVPKEEVLDFVPVEKCEEIIGGYKGKPEITLSESAWYNLTEDKIGIPAKKDFKSIEEYYGTLFHEMIHSTGHPSRLNRNKDTKVFVAFGSEDYGKEELVAELGASFLAYEGGVNGKDLFNNSTSYIQGWLKKLKDDRKLIVSASSQAQKAVDHILGVEWD